MALAGGSNGAGRTSAVATGTFCLDVAFDILSNERRREFFDLLAEDGTVTLAAVADELSDGTRKDRKRVYVSFYQAHLPKLADAGVVEWDDEHGSHDSIEPGEHFAEVYAALLRARNRRSLAGRIRDYLRAKD